MTAPPEIRAIALSEGLAKYQVEDQPEWTFGLRVIAIAHQHRKPHYWKKRVQA